MMVSLNFLFTTIGLVKQDRLLIGGIQKAFSGEHKSAISARPTKGTPKTKSLQPGAGCGIPLQCLGL